MLAYRAKIDRMDDKQRAKHDDDWSVANQGQHYGWYPALPYHACYPDMLHMALNQFNDATLEAFHSHLLDEAYTQPALKALATTVRDKVNVRLKGHADQGGAGVLLTFGQPGKLHVANGPKMKSLLRSPRLLLDLCELMRPLYAACEAAGEESVKMRPLSKADLDAAKADDIAAELTAAAGAQGAAGAGAARTKPGGAGSKAQQKAAAARKRLANLNRAGRNRPVAMPEAAAQPDAPTPHAAAEAPAEAAADDNGGAGATPEEAEELRARLAAAGECLADSLTKYEERVAWMFVTQIEWFHYGHQHQLSSSGIDAAYRRQRALEASRLGLEVERAMLACIGTKRRRTYGHDIVYGLAGLYMLLGKPYLGACEHNEAAHKEMKFYFRHMSSKNSKRRCACLQVLDLMTAKRVLVERNKEALPRTAYTQMRTAIVCDRKRAGRSVDSNDGLLESKVALGTLLPGQGAVKADPANLDPETRVKIAKRSEVQGEGGEPMQTG